MNIVDWIRSTRTEARHAVASFTRLQLVLFSIASLLFVGSAIRIITTTYNRIHVPVPAVGGTTSEGIIGIPRFINPVLALSDADRDLTALVYSGLVRKLPDGSIINDTAASYTISEDGLTYTFTLRPDVYFHDGKPVTAADVLFTIGLLQDPLVKSPRRIAWEGVRAQSPDDQTVVFTLRQPYASFIESATIGILPKHLFDGIAPEELMWSTYNIHAIGSGPFKIDTIKQNRKTNTIESITVKRFKDFVLGAPYINKITFQFFSQEKDAVAALQKGTIKQLGAISAETAHQLKVPLQTNPLPRIFGVYFNTANAPVLAEKAVREALHKALDRDALIETVLYGYGTAITSPLPPHRFTEKTSVSTFDEARTILEKAGWVLGEDGVREKKTGTATQRLAFSMTTSDTPELRRAAEYIAQTYQLLGAEVTLKIFDTSTLNQEVIRPRAFDMLFFGQVVSHESDLYAFWHSSQRSDPGLNIARYASARSDNLLEQGLTETDTSKRYALYTSFAEEIAKDRPAIFVYAPYYIYAQDQRIKGIRLGDMVNGSERFAQIYQWYIETEPLLPFFIKNES